jgi:hypothetical protein
MGMSSDEKIETRDESVSNDVEAHMYVTEAPKEDGSEGEETADLEGTSSGSARSSSPSACC